MTTKAGSPRLEAMAQEVDAKRLADAAPDLLGALLDNAVALSDFSELKGISNDMRALAALVLKQTRAVIAKATGNDS